MSVGRGLPKHLLAGVSRATFRPLFSYAPRVIAFSHAKSDWDSGAAADFDRPLAKRGRKDAPLVGAWLYREGVIPAHFVSSPAARARETALLVCKALDLKKKRIVWDQGVYEADLDDLLAVLARVSPEALTVLLVGHNLRP